VVWLDEVGLGMAALETFKVGLVWVCGEKTCRLCNKESR
jgi:hypothetical protein